MDLIDHLNQKDKIRWVLLNKHRFVFLHVPKTAGVSIRKVLIEYGMQRACDLPDGQLLHEHLMLPSFAFVRNPWDRLASGFGFFHRHNIPIKIGGKNVMSINLRGMNFEEFVLDHSWDGDRPSNDHWRPQHELLEFEGEFIVDKIFRFERLQKDFRLACDHIGIEPTSLSCHNASTHEPFESMYTTQEMIDVVAKRYARDIELFGYEPPTLASTS